MGMTIPKNMVGITRIDIMKKLLDFLTLFSSASTLICCALPALLVALGAGSVMASLASNVPGLIWISAHKMQVFIFAGIMLTFGGILQYRARNMACPIDPDKAKACGKGRKWSRIVYFFSLTIYLIGGFMAFIAPKLI